MSTTTTAIILKNTNHVLAAYTQKSGTKEPLSSKQLEDRFFRNGLQLRFVERRLTATITTTALDVIGETLAITSPETLGIKVGDRLLIKDNAVETIVRIKTVKSQSQVSPFTAELEIAVELKPSKDIQSGSKLISIGRSPVNEPFQFASRFLCSVVLPPDAIDIKSQPTAFVIKDGKPDLIPAVSDAIKYIAFTVQLTGVNISIHLDPTKSMDSDIPVVCVLRTAAGENVVSTATIPKVPQNSTRTEATIPFAAFPSGDNLFLFMLKGFPPIWDRLPVTGKRTWTLST